jgi:phosphoribosylaminoimidazolecarboxamide formyltransferase / IMP cyclohydrolase
LRTLSCKVRRFVIIMAHMSINDVNRIEGDVTMRHVMISVADKSGLDELVNGLVGVNANVKIYSTGGTYARIEAILGSLAETNLLAVSSYTGQPEMQGGLVKTLDFKIYLGLLSESYNDDHSADLLRVGAVAFDMVVGNLYPFRSTVAQDGATLENARGNIDIGGPCMLRAAAKNFLRVAAVCDPADYPALVEELKGNGGALTLETRFRFAKRAFRHTADYDAAIADYLESKDISSVSGTYEIS